MVYKEKDTERVRPNPYIAIARSAFAEVKSLAAEFGLTPANRTAIIANALTAEKSYTAPARRHKGACFDYGLCFLRKRT